MEARPVAAKRDPCSRSLTNQNAVQRNDPTPVWRRAESSLTPQHHVAVALHCVRLQISGLVVDQVDLQHAYPSTICYKPTFSHPVMFFSSTIRQLATRLVPQARLAAVPTPNAAASSSRSIAHICSHSLPRPHSHSSALARLPPSALLSRIRTVQVRGFKVRSSVKRMCEDCYVVRRCVCSSPGCELS